MNHYNESKIFPETLKQSYLPSIDGLRGVAIIFVLLSHFFFEEKETNLFLQIFSGSFGVHIFFVISGFLITTLLLKEKTKFGKVSLYHFYVRRFLRIFPVAYLYLFILFLIDFASGLNVPLNGFISSLLYIRNTSILPSSDWLTGHYWSLSVEEQFYLVFPFIFSRNIKLFFYSLVFFLLIIPMITYANFHEMLQTRTLQLIYELTSKLTGILVGAISATLFFYKKIKINIGFSYRGIVSLILITSAAFLESNLTSFIPSALLPLLSSVLISVLLLSNLDHQNTFFFKFLNNKLIIQIGVLSYSLYIWQQIFTQNVPWKHLFVGADNKLFNLFFLLLTSYLSYHFFEKKFLQFKKRFTVSS